MSLLPQLNYLVSPSTRTLTCKMSVMLPGHDEKSPRPAVFGGLAQGLPTTSNSSTPLPPPHCLLCILWTTVFSWNWNSNSILGKETSPVWGLPSGEQEPEESRPLNVSQRRSDLGTSVFSLLLCFWLLQSWSPPSLHVEPSNFNRLSPQLLATGNLGDLCLNFCMWEWRWNSSGSSGRSQRV